MAQVLARFDDGASLDIPHAEFSSAFDDGGDSRSDIITPISGVFAAGVPTLEDRSAKFTTSVVKRASASKPAAAPAPALVPSSKYTGSGCPGLHAPWPTLEETDEQVGAGSSTGKPSGDASPLSWAAARIAFAVFSAITMVAIMDLAAPTMVASAGAQLAASAAQIPSYRYVWGAGWITAVSTGLGVLPFAIVGDIRKFWLGACNALACGMMAAASVGLLFEAVHVQEEYHMAGWSAAWVRAAAGAVGGAAFIIGTKHVLEQHEDLQFSGMSGASASKMLLIMAVMTLHSLAEGVGIGVSFAGASGSQFGMFISTTLAIHNVPEGLAICLVLVPRGVGLLEASMWAVISSLPQPLMAVPAFMSVQAFLPFLPVGLGFAAGAMLYVAFFELLPEALEDVDRRTALCTASVAATIMGSAQYLLH